MADALSRRRAVEPDELEQAVDAPGVDGHYLRRDGKRLAPAPAAVLGSGVEEYTDPPPGIGDVAIATAEHDGLALVRLRKPRQQSERRRLAGAVRA